tara:strand:- start:2207 stop:2656 length:450 start_codon:yes stop_codon:yes gene_type:complete
MINDLIKFANHLDSKGLHKEADYLDVVIKKKAVALPPNLLQMVITFLMPMADPMCSAMIDECMADIEKDVMKDCVGMFKGIDRPCIKEVSTRVIEKKMSDPAVVQRVLAEGLKAISIPQSLSQKIPVPNMSSPLSSGQDIMPDVGGLLG